MVSDARQSRDLFRRYYEGKPDTMATRWARSLVVPNSAMRLGVGVEAVGRE